MDGMTDPRPPLGELPPIPDGCGIMPIAENRIVHGAHGELFEVLPEAPLSAQSAAAPAPTIPASADSMEQLYRRVLARALALAACALLLAACAAASLIHNFALQQSFVAAQLLFRVVFVTQLLFIGVCSRYVEKLAIAPAAVLLFSYAAFCALEFSALLSPATLAVAFLCAALMYGVTALWGFLCRADLARPITGVFLILSGGVILVAVNLLLHTPSFTWTLSSLAVVVFAVLAVNHAQEIRDFYQEFDDDNAEGWKASVLGALLLIVNSGNLYLLAATFLGRFVGDAEKRTGKSRRESL
jgi:FtsH-binding integral membrane protein